MSFWSRLTGSENGAALRRALPIVEAAGAHEASMQALSDDELRQKTAEFKARLGPPAGGGKTLEDIAPEAFAAVREASRRTLKQRHFDVQLIGGMILHNGD